MANITRLHHTGFTVKSIERSKAFYCGILGFELAFEWNPVFPYLRELVGYPTVDLLAAILRLPGTDVCLELLEYRNIEQAPVDMRNGNVGNGHIAFNVDHLDELYANLLKKGVTSVSKPVTPTAGPNKGGRAVYLIDPDSFRVELIESAQKFGTYKPD
jgi:lactoylglutathione lyase